MSYETETRQLNIVSVVILALSIAVAYLLFTSLRQKSQITISQQQIELLEANLDMVSQNLNKLEAKQNIYMDKDMPNPLSLGEIDAPQLGEVEAVQENLKELNSNLNVVDDMMNALDELASKAAELEEAEARGEDVSAEMDKISAELGKMEKALRDVMGVTGTPAPSMPEAQ